jgi:tetratricopeptide (TPR) repeat protein
MSEVAVSRLPQGRERHAVESHVATDCRAAQQTPRDCGALELTYDEQTEPPGSAAMMIACTGIRPASKTRPWLVPVLAAVLALGIARSADAQTDAHDLMEGRGRDVSFPVSCAADIQPRFDAALAALHSFWYGQALKEFTAITEAKPDCAMAYWGVAMSVWNQIWAPPTPANLKKGSDAITRALALGAQTQRERDYLDALAAFYTGYDALDHRTRAAAYMRKMEQVAQRYPDDREARIFYALSLLATADGLDKTYKNQLKAGEILEQIFAEKPQHPGPSHYIIHAYDYPALVDRALAAAQNYAICVTVVPHAIHMPSHTYVLLGRWKDTITANNAAETAEADRGTPEDRIHALDYLVYAHLQLAQDVKAKEVLDLALKIENDLVARQHDSGLRARPFGVAAMEARWALERLDWATAVKLPLRPSRYPYAESVPHFARAVGLARSGRPEQASADLERLAALQKALADAKNLYWARQVSIQLKVASAWVERGLGRDAEAAALMQEAATAEETSETHDTLSPGPIGMTAHEALGLLLLELGRPSEAFEAFEASFRSSKNRLRSYAGAAAAAAAVGNTSAARSYYTKLLELADGSDGGRPELAQAKAYLQHVNR